jgi:ABC-type lipoprotein release transport system permease subunit
MPLLAGLLFDVTAADPVNYVLICALVLTVSGLAAFLPARHAVGIDPIVALRHE